MIEAAAKKLDRAEMVRYDSVNGFLSITDMGRTASHFYINTETITRFNGKFTGTFMNDCELFSLISEAQEFDQLKVRKFIYIQIYMCLLCFIVNVIEIFQCYFIIIN